MNDPCPICGRPIADTAYVCARCVEHAAGELRRLASTWHEIETTITRQSVSVGVVGGTRRDTVVRGPVCRGMTCEHESCDVIWRSRHRALTEPAIAHESATPANLAASEQAWIIRNTVTTWARHVRETRGIDIPVVRPRVLQPQVLSVLHDRPQPLDWWCEFGDLPNAVCACDNPNATHPRRTA